MTYAAWVRATSLGWLLGVPLIAVFALIGEALGIGGSQFLVGAGMGAGIGLLQARLMRRVLDRFTPWFLSCVVGLSVPFLGADGLRAAGREHLYSLQVCVALGGLAVGGWQSALLSRRFLRTWLWLIGSAVGYALAAACATLADVLSRTHALRGPLGALVYLGTIAAGGPILGLVTGVPLRRLVPRGPQVAE